MTRSADRDLPPAPIDRLLGFGGRDAVALIGREGSLTYQGLDALAGRVAAGLVRAGAKTGDRVASWMGKTLASAVLPFACARAGLIHVPINPLLKSHQAAHILADSAAALLVTLPRSEERRVGKEGVSECRFRWSP